MSFQSFFSLRFPLLVLACLLLGGCAGRAERGIQPAHDFHLIMGELALLREQPHVAVEQYLLAALQMNDPGVARRGLMIAIHADDMDSAQVLADHWEALQPDDNELQQYQGVLKFRAGRNDTALDYLLRATDNDNPAVVAANLQAVTGLLAGEDNVWRAADVMARLAAAREAHPEGWHGAALLALEADRPEQASRFAARVLALQPNLLDAQFLLARAELKSRPAAKPAVIEDILSPLRQYRHANDPGIRYRYAGLLMAAGRHAEADAMLQDILLIDPEQHDARLARALLALEQAQYEQAEAELQRLSEHYGHLSDALYFLGVLAEHRGQPQQAILQYGRIAPAVSAPERWLDAQSAIARLLHELEGANAIGRYFQELREQWPEQSFELALREAAVLNSLGEAQRALARLDRLKAPADTRNGRELRWQTAIAAIDAGQITRAQRLLRRLVEDDPGNPVFMNALGWLLLEHTSHLDEAEMWLLLALEMAPANPAILDSVGRLRFRQGRLEDALPLLVESWRREPAALTGLHLLELFAELDNPEAYLGLLQELTNRFPGRTSEEETP